MRISQSGGTISADEGGFMARNIFWGIVFILIGIAVVANHYFGLHIPVVNTVIAIALIAAGIQIVFGGCHGHMHDWHSHDWNGLGYQVIKYEPGSGDKKYDLHFKGFTIDLDGVTLDKGNVRIDITGSFGGGAVLLNPSVPARIDADISFGGVTFPDGSVIGFGKGAYESPGFSHDANHLYIKVDASFGGLRFTNDKNSYNDWHSMKNQWRYERRMWRHNRRI